VRKELEAYGHGLAEKNEVIALTKIDALGDELAEDVRQDVAKTLSKDVHMISSISGAGVKEIVAKLSAQMEPDETE